MSLPEVMTWDDIEKFVTDNPGAILSIYALKPATFLDDKLIILNGQRWGIDHKKFRQIASDIFGMVNFALRKDSNEQT